MKVYEGVVLKKRLNLFIFSVFLGFLIPIFLFVYHAMPENVIFRTSYFLTLPGVGVVAAYLVYKGFGKELD